MTVPRGMANSSSGGLSEIADRGVESVEPGREVPHPKRVRSRDTIFFSEYIPIQKAPVDSFPHFGH
jgi:hypothetical protein